MEFDIYYPFNYEEFLNSLKKGVTLDLDGIDGFFDQYFEGRPVGDVIHFIPSLPSDRNDFHSLPLIEARIQSCDSISGTVVVRSVTPFESWMMELPNDSLSETDPHGEIDSILDQIPEFETHESFYWVKPHEQRRRQPYSAINAILGIPTDAGFRIAALTSNETVSVIVSRPIRGE